MTSRSVKLAPGGGVAGPARLKNRDGADVAAGAAGVYVGYGV